MSDASADLPELHSGDLDAETVGALFDDLERHAVILDVLVKAAPNRHVSGAALPLREAQALLAAREVRGVQIRYHWQGAEWRDTLMQLPTAVRVVRMRMP